MSHQIGCTEQLVTRESETWFLTLAPPLADCNFESLNFAILAEILNYDVYDLLYNLAVLIKASVCGKALEPVKPLCFKE